MNEEKIGKCLRQGEHTSFQRRRPMLLKRMFHSWLFTRFITRVTWRVPLVKQELLTIPEYPSSPPVFSGVCVTQFLVVCVCFVDRCLFFCPLKIPKGGNQMIDKTLHMKSLKIPKGGNQMIYKTLHMKSLKIPKGGNQMTYKTLHMKSFLYVGRLVWLSGF
jgi:hypothetical protein